jgi:hypothetical protein
VEWSGGETRGTGASLGFKGLGARRSIDYDSECDYNTMMAADFGTVELRRRGRLGLGGKSFEDSNVQTPRLTCPGLD